MTWKGANIGTTRRGDPWGGKVPDDVAEQRRGVAAGAKPLGVGEQCPSVKETPGGPKNEERKAQARLTRTDCNSFMGEVRRLFYKVGGKPEKEKRGQPKQEQPCLKIKKNLRKMKYKGYRVHGKGGKECIICSE